MSGVDEENRKKLLEEGRRRFQELRGKGATNTSTSTPVANRTDNRTGANTAPDLSTFRSQPSFAPPEPSSPYLSSLKLPQTTNGDITDRYNSIQPSIDSSALEIESWRQRCKILEGKMDMVIAEKARLEEDNKELRASFDKAKQDKEALQSETMHAKTRVISLDAEVQSLKTQLSTSTDRKTADSIVQQLQADLVALTNTAQAEKENHAIELKKITESSAVEVSRLQKMLEDERYAHRTQLESAAKNTQRVMNSQATQHQSEMDAVVAKYKKMSEEDRAKLKHELGTVTTELSQAKLRVAALEKEFHQLADVSKASPARPASSALMAGKEFSVERDSLVQKQNELQRTIELLKSEASTKDSKLEKLEHELQQANYKLQMSSSTTQGAASPTSVDTLPLQRQVANLQRETESLHQRNQQLLSGMEKMMEQKTQVLLQLMNEVKRNGTLVKENSELARSIYLQRQILEERGIFVEEMPSDPTPPLPNVSSSSSLDSNGIGSMSPNEEEPIIATTERPPQEESFRKIRVEFPPLVDDTSEFEAPTKPPNINTIAAQNGANVGGPSNGNGHFNSHEQSKPGGGWLSGLVGKVWKKPVQQTTQVII